MINNYLKLYKWGWTLTNSPKWAGYESLELKWNELLQADDKLRARYGCLHLGLLIPSLLRLKTKTSATCFPLGLPLPAPVRKYSPADLSRIPISKSRRIRRPVSGLFVFLPVASFTGPKIFLPHLRIDLRLRVRVWRSLPAERWCTASGSRAVFPERGTHAAALGVFH